MTPPAPLRPDGDAAAGLPVAPGLLPLLADAAVLAPRVDRRVVRLSALAVLVAAGASLAARWMLTLIDLCTNVSWYGRFSTAPASPAGHGLGAWGALVPVAGGVVVGLMARYGSKAIRGHGIPEAMEQILKNESRIPARVLFLKPLSAAVSIGTGGPFGAEGPIISTGGALGSLVGQFIKITAMERKTLLAAGAAAGMTAIFGTPVAAVLLAVELLLFELRPRSLIPVAAAAVTAMGFHAAFVGSAPIFPMPSPEPAAPLALLAYAAIGALVGVAAVGVTRLVYAIEDAFELLPVHWMWWPALGAVVVGLVGALDRRTLGVGYENIGGVLSGGIVGWSLASLMILKFVSWSVSLGSGTSGGTLAPLLTIGGALGALLGAGLRLLFPDLPIDPRVAALVGMAAMFAGASRALLTSVVFAFEATRQPLGLVPILSGSAAAYLVSCLTMRHTIMTEKIERRGVRVPSEYAADHLDGVLVRDAASVAVVALAADLTVEEARSRISSDPKVEHTAFPVVDGHGRLVGVAGRRDLFARSADPAARVTQILRRPPVAIFEDQSLREACDTMAAEHVGRLPVLSRAHPGRVVGILSRRDVLAAERSRIDETRVARRHIDLRVLRPFRRGDAPSSRA